MSFLLRAPLFAVLLTLFFSAVAVAQQTTWADRLGYPPGERVILVHAYGAGLCHETNAATAAALESGAATCASAMPPCPWFAHAASMQLGEMGLAFTINSELPEYRWRPMAASLHTESLVSTEGYFWASVRQTMVMADPVDVEYELRAQLQRARELGIKPTHLTTHLGALFMRPDLAEVYLRVAKEHWTPAVVVELTQEHLERFRAQGFPIPDSMIRIMAEFPLPKLDDLRFCPRLDSYEQKKAELVRMINELRPGITQLALHPAVDSPALRALSEDWQQMVWEAQLLEDAEVRAALSAEGISLASWSDLMARFEGRAAEERVGDEQ